jgi:cysteine dioxygenase
LATQIEPSANSATGNYSPENKISFPDFVEILSSQTEPPSLAQLYSWLENANFSEEELKPYLGFKERTYWRHLVCRTEAVEMLVLCWKPGQRTVIHDHNGSCGAVLIQSGVVWETTFVFDEVKGLRYQSVSEHQAGAVTGADVPDIHQLGNPDVSEKDLITIHVYSPPLGVLHTYKPGSAEIELYTPEEPDANRCLEFNL